MKYIKTFEDNSEEEVIYNILIKSTPVEYIFLLSVISENDVYYYGYLKYVFRKSEGYEKQLYNYHISNYNKSGIENNILFKSENIEDCFEYMEQYANTKKYNL